MTMNTYAPRCYEEWFSENYPTGHVPKRDSWIDAFKRPVKTLEDAATAIHSMKRFIKVILACGNSTYEWCLAQFNTVNENFSMMAGYLDNLRTEIVRLRQDIQFLKETVSVNVQYITILRNQLAAAEAAQVTRTVARQLNFEDFGTYE